LVENYRDAGIIRLNRILQWVILCLSRRYFVKRIISLTIVILGALALSAQNFENESEYYAKTVPITKIYTHREGYRIDYLREGNQVGIFWAPSEWFRGSQRKGGIAFGEGIAYPYASFFFKDGVLNHFRLYLVESLAHESWGTYGPEEQIAPDFPPADASPEIDF